MNEVGPLSPPPRTAGPARRALAAGAASVVMLAHLARAGAPPLEPVETRIDAVMGASLVVPVGTEAGPAPASRVEARLEDGRPVPARLVWFGIAPLSPGAGPRPESSVERWLPPTTLWTSAAAGEPSAGRPPTGGAGMWSLVLDLPVDAAGQAVWVNGRRWALNWLPEPGALDLEESDWSPPLTAEERSSPWLARSAMVEARSPARRWRAGLIRGGLAPQSAVPDHDGHAGPFADADVEAMAVQIEGRWRAGLALLAVADRNVAAQVRRRLACAADFGGGTIVPAWPTDAAELDLLLTDLLNPSLPGSRKAARARAWLESQPAAAAWVADDAGQRDAATGLRYASCGIANLLDRSLLGWADVEGQRSAAEPVALRPFAVGTVSVSFAAAGPDAGDEPAAPAAPDAIVHAGSWSGRRPVRLGSAPLVPPGAMLGPFVPEWTMSAWLAGEEGRIAAGDPAWGTAARLFKSAEGWEVFVECRQDAPGDDSVRVWIGSFGAPAAVLTAARKGPEPEQRTGRAAGKNTAFECRAVPGGYVARLRVPDAAIDPDGTIRVGLERTDARGVRSSWPRPMLPWQSEPGRIALDTRAWGEVGEPPARGAR